MRKLDIGRSALALVLTVISLSSYAQGGDIGYDAAADPFALLQAAEAQAGNEEKFVLVIAGGDWCIWCHYLHAFLDDNADLHEALDQTFVVMQAYYGDENENPAFFATLPEAVGYPHFWVLNSNGKLLASQNTAPLEDGDKSYNRDNFLAFIAGWEEKRRSRLR
jgi:thiol:disulfide interchange protein